MIVPPTIRLSALLALEVAAAFAHEVALPCVEFTTKIDAAATNVAGITLNSTGNDQSLHAAGSFDIAFRFCRPLVRFNRHASTVQVLGHGASYTKSYWNFPYRPELYSYELRAVSAGFSTLSYDLLGAGNSEKADPFDEVQIPMNVAIAAAIVRLTKAGKLSRRVPTFKKVVYVGHSMGSLILNGVLTLSPHIIDAAVLTGYSHLPIHTPTLANGDIQIAAKTFPDRFGKLSHGYTVIEDRAMFYGHSGTFDRRALGTDVETQDVVSVGDAYTLSYGIHPAPDFRGPILLICGELDAGNCASNCSNIPQEHIYFPKATSFEWHVIPQTGHVLNMHYTAPYTFSLILEWNIRKGF